MKKRAWPSMGETGKGAGWVTPGDRFGNWVVVKEDAKRRGAAGRFWFCRCVCGKIKSVAQKSLRGYASRPRGSSSCGGAGCRLSKTHGMSKTNLYRIWSGMKARCENKKAKHFDNYGGRGVLVCKRWQKFENFAADMGERPSNQHSIERKNGRLGYGPGNCTWATRLQQQSNTRSNVLVSRQGEAMTLMDWARKLKMRPGLLYQRHRRGMITEDILYAGKLRQSRNRPRRTETAKKK